MIQAGSTVSIEYTLKLDDGTVADTNVGAEPLVYEHGANQILPGFEREVAGMAVEQTREFTLSAEEGYGPVQEELRQEVEAELIPKEAHHVGAQLTSEDPSGNRRLVRVHEVQGDKIVVDMNHPLAGQSLHFEVKIVSIG